MMPDDAPAPKRGQPTKYRPEYREQVMAWGKEGKSLEWMCAELGIVYNTLTASWPRLFPEFAEALELAQLYALQWWEDKGQKGIESRDFNAQVYSRSMAARFPDKWRETKGHEVTGKGGAPLVTPDLSNLTDDQKRLLAMIPLMGERDAEEAPDTLQ